MSYYIHMTDELFAEKQEEIKESMKKKCVMNGALSYTTCLKKDDSRATVQFELKAWLKMCALIDRFKTEVAWHGLCHREAAGVYTIYDIFVYPQLVSSTEVQTDELEYPLWMSNEKNVPNEVFNDVRMQAHSHVEMSTSPSSTDMKSQETIFRDFSGSMYYIFMIWNKRLERTIWVYDMQTNTMWDNSGVDVKVLGDDFGFMDFLRKSDSLVGKKYAYSLQPNYTYTYPQKKETAKPCKPPVKTKEPKKTNEKEVEDIFDIPDYYSKEDSAFFAQDQVLNDWMRLHPYE